MRTREDIERLEDSILADYAMKSSLTAGRRYQEPKHSVRTCYQRDRDRVVHSEAFRRLEYKTQVFVVLEDDYYRTRLTHTIEVAQIARTIGRALCLNEDLIEAIALAHDLGHPPFGHAGEDSLNKIMQQLDPSSGFNHNLHSYDIVNKLEKRYPDFDGLNLTEEVLVGILKHRSKHDVSEDVENYFKIGPTLEAKVVDIADSIAYLSHDIDDGLTSGFISEDELLDSPLWKKSLNHIDDTVSVHQKDVLKYQIVKALIDLQIKDLLGYFYNGIKKHNFMTVEDVKMFLLEYPEESPVGFSPAMKEERTVLQKLLNDKLYHHYRVVRMSDKAHRIINDLFEVYMNNPKQLPYSVYRRDFEYSEKKKYQIICHYIASMTDRFAIDEHKKLFDPYTKV